jgi:ABC-2 type transport system ATP-binding protein
MNTIETFNLTKKFNGFTAVDNVSLKIREGELFGLLGPNGAGKTTTLKMLSTLINPTSGTATVAGFDILTESDRVRESIGMVFQDMSLDIELTGRENLDFHARMYGMPKELREKRMREVLELVGLDSWADTVVKKYSGGMQRLLEIARGLMHYPKVLFLDEPTLGLDAQARRRIWDYIKELNKRENITIILTTHYMEEADYLCDRVGIIDRGKIVALDKPDALKDRVGRDMVTLEMENSNEEAVEAFEKFEWVNSVSFHDGILHMCVKNAEKRIPDIMETAKELGLVVTSVSLRKPTLEDVFLHYTGRTIKEVEASSKHIVRQIIRRRRRLWVRRR